MAYLNLMLNNRADFILKYNESTTSSPHSLKREQRIRIGRNHE
jgi:hypothetical protein